MKNLSPEELDSLNGVIGQLKQSQEMRMEGALRSIDLLLDLSVRNLDREFNLILSLNAISVAFFTIAAPLLRDTASIFLNFATLFFLLTAVLGTILLISTILDQQYFLDKNEHWQSVSFTELQEKEHDILVKLIGFRNGKEFPEKEIMDHITDFEDDAGLVGFSKVMKFREKKLSSTALRYCKVPFWISLVISILFLILWFAFQIFSPQS